LTRWLTFTSRFTVSIVVPPTLRQFIQEFRAAFGWLACFPTSGTHLAQLSP
jgi:hypothetical protein